jgi:hypothetical protein
LFLGPRVRSAAAAFILFSRARFLVLLPLELLLRLLLRPCFRPAPLIFLFRATDLYQRQTEMDSSDILRKTQAKAIFAYYKETKLSLQPTCNYSTCSSITGCVVQYPSYAEKQAVTVGQQTCNACAATGCGCTGGS